MTLLENQIPFTKMHGLGNDFVIIDRREKNYQIDVKKISNRKLGVGCDQLCLIEKSGHKDCDIGLTMFNADGTPCGGCGNATRCVAFLIIEEINKKELKIFVQLEKRILKCWKIGHKMMKVDMGEPLLEWNEIPLSKPCDTLCLPYSIGELSQPSAVGIGSPHIVFFVKDINAINLEKVGPLIEHDSLFPNRININIAQVKNDGILLRVWERGVGETLACGTGACSTVVSAIRRKLIEGNSCKVSLPGGDLYLEWKDTVLLTGPVQKVFTGIFNCD